MSSRDSTAPVPAQTRRRIVELERRVEDLQIALGLQRAGAATDGFRWILQEGRNGPAVRSSPSIRFRHPVVTGLFSVVIPAFNAERFLTRAVESVWSQTLSAAQIEIVVADDGSQDGTCALARKLARQSPIPLQVCNHPHRSNRGVAATRNLACAHSRGEFFAFLDADDAFLPERLSAADEFFRRNPDTLGLCSLGRNVDETDRPVVGHNGTEVAGQWRGLDHGDTIQPPFTFEMLWRTDPVANSSLTIRRGVFAEVGGFPAVMAHQAEDWLLVLKLSLLAPLSCIDRELFLYRHHADAYTHGYHAGNLRDGARLELFFHLVHWMLRQAGLAERARLFFRKEYPRVLAAHHRLFPVIRDYGLRRGTGTPSLADFEDYMARTIAELECLRRVVQSCVNETRRWRQEALALRTEGKVPEAQ